MHNPNQLTQEEQNKISQQKLDNENAIKRHCRGCKHEVYPRLLCQCAGGGGGDSGSGEDEHHDMEDNVLMQTPESMDQVAAEQVERNEESYSFARQIPVLTPRESMLAMIAELLAMGLLTIEDNKALCTLAIKCNPALLSDLQRKAVNDFVNELLSELQEFKERNGLKDSRDCIVKIIRDKDQNVMSALINIPNATYYNKFIEQLKSLALLPRVKSFAEESSEQEQLVGMKKFNPSPFSVRPEPR